MEGMREAGYGSTEGEHSWLRSRDLQWAVENMASPEARAAIIEKIAYLLAWLVEAGPGADPDLRNSRRAQLQGHLAQLGIDFSKPHWGILYGEALYQIAWERENPPLPPKYPSFDQFATVVSRLISQKHPLFADLRGRDSKEITPYLYGLGFIMASELSYRYIFPTTDPIVVNQRTGHIDGRHHLATLTILDQLGFDIRQWYWIRPESTR